MLLVWTFISLPVTSCAYLPMRLTISLDIVVRSKHSYSPLCIHLSYICARFYSHLVDVLGPDEFLAPICILLVEKLSKRLIRQQKSDAETSLSLSISMFQNYNTKRKMGVRFRWSAKQLTRLTVPPAFDRDCT